MGLAKGFPEPVPDLELLLQIPRQGPGRALLLPTQAQLTLPSAGPSISEVLDEVSPSELGLSPNSW